jgi:hypothetical protein
MINSYFLLPDFNFKKYRRPYGPEKNRLSAT